MGEGQDIGPSTIPRAIWTTTSATATNRRSASAPIGASTATGAPNR